MRQYRVRLLALLKDAEHTCVQLREQYNDDDTLRCLGRIGALEEALKLLDEYIARMDIEECKRLKSE